MFKRLSQLFQSSTKTNPALNVPSELQLGQVVIFSEAASVPELHHQRGIVVRRRAYHFQGERLLDYVIRIEKLGEYTLSLRHEEEVSYVGVSRELSSAEKAAWFDPDALSFFLEESSARTIRCKTLAEKDQPWAAERYMKSVDLLPGTVVDADRENSAPSPLLYSMLLSQFNEKAVEIEQYKEHGLVRLYVTVFMPSAAMNLEDVKVNAASDESAPLLFESAEGIKKEVPKPTLQEINSEGSAQIIPINEAFDTLTKTLKETEKESHSELADSAAGEVSDIQAEVSATESEQKKQTSGNGASLNETAKKTEVNRGDAKIFRNDFRRLDVAEKTNGHSQDWGNENDAPLPDFLLEPKYGVERDDALFQQIFSPDENQIICDDHSADVLKNLAKSQGVSVQDLVRDTVGLNNKTRNSAVHIDLPLSEEDYKKLAMRYQIKPNKKDEIRKRVSAELMQRLVSPSAEH